LKYEVELNNYNTKNQKPCYPPAISVAVHSSMCTLVHIEAPVDGFYLKRKHVHFSSIIGFWSVSSNELCAIDEVISGRWNNIVIGE